MSNSYRAFLYNIQTDKFVDFDNNEYKEFPFLPDSIIYLNSDSIIINSIINELSRSYHKCIKLVKREKNLDNFKNKKSEEIKDTLSNNEVYVYVSSPVFNYYYKVDEYYGCIIKTDLLLMKVFMKIYLKLNINYIFLFYELYDLMIVLFHI